LDTQQTLKLKSQEDYIRQDQDSDGWKGLEGLDGSEGSQGSDCSNGPDGSE